MAKGVWLSRSGDKASNLQIGRRVTEALIVATCRDVPKADIEALKYF
jgi:hypothetical protein